MVEDAYYSITAAGRVIAQANEANLTESAVLNDTKNAAKWQQDFDHNINLIAVRMCGQPGCLAQPFTANYADTILPDVAQRAESISKPNSEAIDRYIPLAGNVTFAYEAATLERARQALNKYLALDTQMRSLIANGKLSEATTLNTRESDAAFLNFIKEMEKEQQINRDVFNNLLVDQQLSLSSTRVIYGILGFLLMIVLIAVGIYHRYREL
jgi:hypothetical protein